jgi:phosphonopyruvate decarboxylase
MIDQADMMSVVQKYRGDAVVIPVERAGVAWPQISTNQQRDLSPSVMGKGASFALGLCLSQPDTKVIVLDGDGSLEMNLGTLVTVANKQPRNLYHFVLENGMYATTGGQAIPGKDRVSFSSMARQAGYAAAYDFDDLEDFATQAEKVLNEPGPVLVCIKIVPNPRTHEQREQEQGRRRRSSAEVMSGLRQELGGSTGP